MDDHDVSMLLPVPEREFTNKTLYSWAYHKFSAMGKKIGMDDVTLKHLCRCKARKIVADFGV